MGNEQPVKRNTFEFKDEFGGHVICIYDYEPMLRSSLRDHLKTIEGGANLEFEEGVIAAFDVTLIQAGEELRSTPRGQFLSFSGLVGTFLRQLMVPKLQQALYELKAEAELMATYTKFGAGRHKTEFKQAQKRIIDQQAKASKARLDDFRRKACVYLDLIADVTDAARIMIDEGIEVSRQSLTQEAVAEILKCDDRTLRLRLNGTKVTWEEIASHVIETVGDAMKQSQ
jgi:hypothetical protein